MENYKVRVIENIGKMSKKTFGGIGTEIEVQSEVIYDILCDKDKYKWCFFKGFKELKILFDSDFSGNYRTRFELIE